MAEVDKLDLLLETTKKTSDDIRELAGVIRKLAGAIEGGRAIGQNGGQAVWVVPIAAIVSLGTIFGTVILGQNASINKIATGVTTLIERYDSHEVLSKGHNATQDEQLRWFEKDLAYRLGIRVRESRPDIVGPQPPR